MFKKLLVSLLIAVLLVPASLSTVFASSYTIVKPDYYYGTVRADNPGTLEYTATQTGIYVFHDYTPQQAATKITVTGANGKTIVTCDDGSPFLTSCWLTKGQTVDIEASNKLSNDYKIYFYISTPKELTDRMYAAQFDQTGKWFQTFNITGGPGVRVVKLNVPDGSKITTATVFNEDIDKVAQWTDIDGDTYVYFTKASMEDYTLLLSFNGKTNAEYDVIVDTRTTLKVNQPVVKDILLNDNFTTCDFTPTTTGTYTIYSSRSDCTMSIFKAGTSGPVANSNNSAKLTMTAGIQYKIYFFTDGSAGSMTIGISNDKVTVSGVQNGKYYNSARKITFSGGTALLNGKAYKSGTAISKEGSYKLIVTSSSGEQTTISFVIDTTKPVISAKQSNKSTVKNGGSYTTSSVTVTATDKYLDVKSATLDGRKITYPTSGKFTSLGKYVITVTDKAGNKSTFSFTLKKFVIHPN